MVNKHPSDGIFRPYRTSSPQERQTCRTQQPRQPALDGRVAALFLRSFRGGGGAFLLLRLESRRQHPVGSSSGQSRPVAARRGGKPLRLCRGMARRTVGRPFIRRVRNRFAADRHDDRRAHYPPPAPAAEPFGAQLPAGAPARVAHAGLPLRRRMGRVRKRLGRCLRYRDRPAAAGGDRSRRGEYPAPGRLDSDGSLYQPEFYQHGQFGRQRCGRQGRTIRRKSETVGRPPLGRPADPDGFPAGGRRGRCSGRAEGYEQDGIVGNRAERFGYRRFRNRSGGDRCRRPVPGTIGCG